MKKITLLIASLFIVIAIHSQSTYFKAEHLLVDFKDNMGYRKAAPHPIPIWINLDKSEVIIGENAPVFFDIRQYEKRVTPGKYVQYVGLAIDSDGEPALIIWTICDNMEGQSLSIGYQHTVFLYPTTVGCKQN